MSHHQMATEMEIEVDMAHPPELGGHADDEDLIDYDIDTSDHPQQATFFAASDDHLPDGPSFFDSHAPESVKMLSQAADQTTEDDNAHLMEQDDAHDDMHLDEAVEEVEATMIENGLLEDSIVGDADIFDGSKIDEATITDTSFLDSRHEDDEINYEEFERENLTAAQGPNGRPANPLEVLVEAPADEEAQNPSKDHITEPESIVAPTKATDESPPAILDDRVPEPTLEMERDEISWEQAEVQYEDRLHDGQDDDRPDAQNTGEAAAAADQSEQLPETKADGDETRDSGSRGTAPNGENDDDDDDNNDNDDHDDHDDHDNVHSNPHQDKAHDDDNVDNVHPIRDENESLGPEGAAHDRRSQTPNHSGVSDQGEQTPAITVQYNDHQFPFFSLKDQLGFFHDHSVLDQSMEIVFAGFREELYSEISEEDELVFQVDELGLEFSESGPRDALSDITLRQILEVFDMLVKNQDPGSSRELSTLLFTKPRTSKRFEFLVESAAAGKGLDEVIHLFGPSRPLIFGDVAQLPGSLDEHIDGYGSSPLEHDASDEGSSPHQAGRAIEAEAGTAEEHEDDNPDDEAFEEEDDGSEYEIELADDYLEKPDDEFVGFAVESADDHAEEDAENKPEEDDLERVAQDNEEEDASEGEEEQAFAAGEELDAGVEDAREEFEEEDVEENEADVEERDEERGTEPDVEPDVEPDEEELDPESLTEHVPEQTRPATAIVGADGEPSDKTETPILDEATNIIDTIYSADEADGTRPDYPDGNSQPLIIHGRLDEVGGLNGGAFEDLEGHALVLEPVEDDNIDPSAATTHSTNTLADEEFTPSNSAAIDAGQILDLEAIEKEVMDAEAEALDEIDWRDEAELVGETGDSGPVPGVSKRARPDDEPIVEEEQDVKRRRS